MVRATHGAMALAVALVVGCGDDSLYSEEGSSSATGSVSSGSGVASGSGGAAAVGATTTASGVGVGGGVATTSSSSTSSAQSSGSGGSQPGPVTDFSKPGSFAVTKSTAKIAMTGCGLSNQMTYDLYVPQGGESATLVALGHGFQRNKNKMVEMANHMASYGVRVVAPDFCHASIGDTDHEQNGSDFVALTSALANGAGVIYAGYSAGGTAAILAAKNDPATVALLGLDAVDSGGLATSAAAAITVPAMGLVGESSSCNSNNNSGTFLVSLTPKGSSVRVNNATHCDFEGPTDFLCTGFCGGTMGGPQKLISHLATAFVAWQSGVDVTGSDWAQSGGLQFEALVKNGQISAL